MNDAPLWVCLLPTLVPMYYPSIQSTPVPVYFPVVNTTPVRHGNPLYCLPQNCLLNTTQLKNVISI